MSGTVTPDENTKCDPSPQSFISTTEDTENVGFDGDVEDGGAFNPHVDEVTTSSPENAHEDCSDFLPLAVELEEGVASSNTVLTNEGVGENDNTVGSSEDTVLSNEGITTEQLANSDGTVSAPNTELLLEQSGINNGDSEQAAGGARISEVSAIPPEVDDDAAVDFDASVYLQQQMHANNQNIEGNAKCYLEDFLLSSAPSSSVAPDSDSASNDEKGMPLHRFPKIVKAMETADYSILQVLYRLLYLRNAWDTEKILAQRILDFSGFNCDPNSEDFYTREVMLRTVSCDVLLSIGKLLCIENLVTTTDFDKLKIEIVSKVMNFLHRPRRRSRKPKEGTGRRSNTSQNRATRGGKAQQRSRNSSEASNKPTKANKARVDTVPETSPCEELVNAIKHAKPGPLSHKLKAAGLSREKLLEMERDLKKRIEAGKASQPKVDLKRLDLSVLKVFSGSSKTAPAPESEADTEETDTEEVEEKEKHSELPRSKNQSEKPEERKKLSEFPNVVSSIEGTPDELLAEVHSLLFLRKGEMNELKDNILSFAGFLFNEDSEEYKKRLNCLNGLKENVVKDIARALYLDPKSDKDATISHLMSFLKKPDKQYLRPTVVAPGMLSDCDVDIEGMSDLDSDDSITCEVVPKRVECIDLISSGEESDEEKKTVVKIKQEPVEKVKETVPPEGKVASAAPTKRYLRDFETITKIVNTHPTEYLVDIYNLLYMTPYEPTTLRKDILDFSGFEFEKGTPEYIKRKQFLDRMLYNSVRRIYNTLIHNTREVKVFSKPTMIGEIFQFLFKLPDTDTSIRPPPPKPTIITPYTLNALSKDSSGAANLNVNLANRGVQLPTQSGKLSDLKRVFQRVACFPCEYLVDVHKLLFMTDCDMKDIRANIFGFKGFSFGVDSPEFNQRKLYLEYLTFHSLRKISSVLTTKTVDLRNSTKHELASHLTEVLKEYTNTYFETEPMGTEPANITTVKAAEPTDPAVEQIVVTPIIQPMRPSPSGTPDPPTSASKDDNMTVSSSTTVATTQPQASVPSKKKKEKEKAAKDSPKPPAVTTSSTESNANLQFPDINLPEVEKYRRIYQSNVKIMPKPASPSNPAGTIERQPPDQIGSTQPSTAFGFHPEFVLQQVTSPYAPLIPQAVPFIQTFPQPIHIQSPYVLPQPAVQTTSKKEDEIGKLMKAEEGSNDSDAGPQHKRMKLVSENYLGSAESNRMAESLSICEKRDDSVNSSSSLHLKIRDAMTKASEDEEDCDKPLSMLLGHPNDKVLKQQICEIVENTNLQEITINGVIQKIFNMYPKFNLNYRKEFIKSSLRSLLYRLGEQESSKISSPVNASGTSDSPDCSVSTTDPRDSPELTRTPPAEVEKWKKNPVPASPSFQQQRKSR